MVNVPLLQKVLDHITAHPEEWRQSDWASKSACGTAYCVAGHAVVMSGYTASFSSKNWATGFCVKDGRRGHIDTVAREVLGLDLWQAQDLFHGRNTMQEIWDIATEITDGEIVVPFEYQRDTE